MTECVEFHSECKQKFGEEVGHTVWKAVNAVFDVLPIAATIDDKVSIFTLYCFLYFTAVVHVERPMNGERCS